MSKKSWFDEDRLESFMRAWLSNPEAQLDFLKLIAAVHDMSRQDHADQWLIDWLDRQRAGLRSIGVK